VEALFSESNSRFLIEATPASLPQLERHLSDHGCPFVVLGESQQELRLVIRSNQQVVIDADVAALKTAWKTPLERSLQRQRPGSSG
jgi:phosphoribosylformylglycinamidine synthase